jgi:hypothetical protein
MNDLHIKKRFDFFTVWPNGFCHIDDILNIIRKEMNLNIIFIQKYCFNNMHDFVMKLYGCDTVPIEHLEAKLNYLYNLPPEVINIFVENLNPQEEIIGDPPFRKIQCQHLIEIKNNIRNLFNPKHSNPNFRIPPLDYGVSHEHVIHASDYEEQVDYYLKILGHKEGIGYLINDNYGLTFSKPFYIPRPKSYSFEKIPINLIKANILFTTHKEVEKKVLPIKDTPHFQALSSDIQIYKNYLYTYRFTYLCDDYSVDKFLKMKTLRQDEIKKISPIILNKSGDSYIILDGVHRAAVMLLNGFPEIESVVFE